MKKSFVSDYLNKGMHGHENYDFVDVTINKDQRLFIDPVLIAYSKDTWSKDANRVIDNFFNVFFDIYRSARQDEKYELLSHAKEQNATRLGYGRGNNGKGNTADGLMEIFKPLEQLVKNINTIKTPVDLTILTPGFAEDRLSDLLTNILHEKLNIFTVSQLKKYGIECNTIRRFWTWNMMGSKWAEVEKPSYSIDGQEILLVPKWIVRNRYLFNINQFFSKIILERYQENLRDPYGKTPSKKNLTERYRDPENLHWQYDHALSYIEEHQEALAAYDKRLRFLYSQRTMSDEKLDSIIYEDGE